MIETIEIWLPIPFAPGYWASNFGRLKSSDKYIVRRGRGIQFKPGRLLKPEIGAGGYSRFSPSIDGKKKHILVHRAVVATFIGECPPDKDECAHRDGDKDNCTPGNLRWATKSENNLDKREHGTSASVRGVEHFNSKLTEEDVMIIRTACSADEYRAMAETYNIHPSTAYRVARGKRWGWLTQPPIEPHESRS